MLTEKAFATVKISDAINSLSLTDYREFSTADKEILKYVKQLKSVSGVCPNCSADIEPNAKFCPQCGKKVSSVSIIGALLEEPISSLSISEYLKNTIHSVFPTVGSVILADRDEIMKIKFIKQVRSWIIKNAAEEFISG